jgi:hypothetical protein
MFDFFRKHWFRVLTFVLFVVLPAIGLVLAIKLKSGPFIASMVGMLAVAVYGFVIPDVKKIWAEYGHSKK